VLVASLSFSTVQCRQRENCPVCRVFIVELDEIVQTPAEIDRALAGESNDSRTLFISSSDKLGSGNRVYLPVSSVGASIASPTCTSSAVAGDNPQCKGLFSDTTVMALPRGRRGYCGKNGRGLFIFFCLSFFIYLSSYTTRHVLQVTAIEATVIHAV